jgi:hypothetical protein
MAFQPSPECKILEIGYHNAKAGEMEPGKFPARSNRLCSLSLVIKMRWSPPT